MKTLFCLVSLTCLLTACATMTPQECQTADWQRVGFADALGGKNILLAEHQQACASVKITPDRQAYMNGYNAGAVQYCTYDKGLEVGKTGLSKSDTCNTPALAANFQRGYERGYKMHSKQSEIDTKQQRLAEIDTQLDKVRNNKQPMTAQEVDLLYREKDVLKQEIELLQKELALL